MAVAFKNEQIYLKLRSEIVSGKLADGCRLPPEEQLARELNIGRVTLRAALKRLEDESFIRRVRGQGTFVAYDGNLTDADSGQSADFYKLPAVQHITHKFLLLFSKKTYRTSSIMICSAVQKRAAEKGVEVVSMDYEFFRNCIAMKRGDELIKKSGITGIILPFHGFIGDEPDLVFFRNLKKFSCTASAQCRKENYTFCVSRSRGRSSTRHRIKLAAPWIRSKGMPAIQ